ncbi:hypothetical protein FHG87_016115 [Trinorchestia longiramus]|nr:hypothetical protein FHG87_016115 [Trinorchestia longiramus]
MGLRNSKKSVDIAASSGSPKKNGTEPTDVKVKDLVEDGQDKQAQTELIEEVAAKEASTKLEEGHANGDTPKKEETASPVSEDAVEADKENAKPQENGKEEIKHEKEETEDKKEKKVKKKRSFRSFSFLRREKKAAKSQENTNGEVAKEEDLPKVGIGRLKLCLPVKL